MKTIKTLFLVVVTLFSTQILNAQCSSSHSYTGTSPTFTFSANSLSPGDNVFWDFDDGSTSNIANPTHTFPYNGHYWVHLQVSNGNCVDTSGTAIDITNLSPAPCDPTFTSVSTGSAYSFTTTNPESYYNYLWNFGDGTTSSASNPTHTYTNNGTYTVTCNLQNYYPYLCNSSYSQTITITNIACSASFSTSNNYNIFDFTPTSTPSSQVGSYSYNWDFGDGNTTTTTNMSNVTHVYSAVGNYNVTCNLVDGTCSNTVSNSVTVSSIYTNSCDASFSVSGNGPFFTFPLNNTPIPSAYLFWDFGDGTTLTSFPGGNTTQHTYLNNGIYNVSCILWDSTTLCTDTAYNTVTVVNIGSTTIQGTVHMGSSTADIGTVYLIYEDTVAGSLTAIDSVSIGAYGFYAFNSVPTGFYYVKAGLLPASIGYSNYLPTYYYTNNYGQLLWNAAAKAYSPNNNSIYDISLIAGTNPGGPAFVGGLVSQGANKVGDPISNALIMVTDLNMNPVGFTYSDPSGHFEIQNLPYGDYLLYPEVMGKVTSPMNFTLSTSNQNVENFQIEINSTSVTVSLTTGIQPVKLFSEVILYPNPVQAELTVDFGKMITSGITIEVLDITGRQISVINRKNSSMVRINTSNLNTGTYVLKLTNVEGTQVFRFIK